MESHCFSSCSASEKWCHEINLVVIDYTVKQTLQGSLRGKQLPFKTILVPFPFVFLFINLTFIYEIRASKKTSLPTGP